MCLCERCQAKGPDELIAAGDRALAEVRRETGFDPHDDEPTNYEALERYLNALEGAVRGQAAALRLRDHLAGPQA